MRAPYWAILALVAIGGLQVGHYYPLLPERMASHFGSGGIPNGWSSKPAFFVTMAVLSGVMLAVFVALPRSLKHLPNSLYNIPNREYWLAPERREETVNAIGSTLAWFGVVTLAFILGISQLTILANLRDPVRLETRYALLLIVPFAASMFPLAIRLLLRFRLPNP